jgi:hypothetical protein
MVTSPGLRMAYSLHFSSHASGKKTSGGLSRSHFLYFLRVSMIRSHVGSCCWLACMKLANWHSGWWLTWAGEAIDVKYVLNGKKSSHTLLVWKRRRRRKRTGSGPVSIGRDHFAKKQENWQNFQPPSPFLCTHTHTRRGCRHLHSLAYLLYTYI